MTSKTRFVKTCYGRITIFLFLIFFTHRYLNAFQAVIMMFLKRHKFRTLDTTNYYTSRVFHRLRDIPVPGLLARANGARLLLPVRGHGAGVRAARGRVQHDQAVLSVGVAGAGRGAVRMAGVATPADGQAAAGGAVVTSHQRVRQIATAGRRRKGENGVTPRAATGIRGRRAIPDRITHGYEMTDA